MDAPTRWPDNLGYVLGDDQRRENVAQPFCQVWAKLSGVVIFDEAQKPSMLNASDPHAGNVRRDRTGVKTDLKRRDVCKSSFVPIGTKFKKPPKQETTRGVKGRHGRGGAGAAGADFREESLKLSDLGLADKQSPFGRSWRGWRPPSRQAAR